MKLPREEVNVILDHVEPGLRRLQPGDPVHPNHSTPQRRERQGMEEAARTAVLCHGPLASLARAHLLGDVAVLPTHKASLPTSDPVLARPKCPPSAVMALAEHLRPKPPPSGDAQPAGAGWGRRGPAGAGGGRLGPVGAGCATATSQSCRAGRGRALPPRV